MSFNVNYFAGTREGLIPLNSDSWLKASGKIADNYIDEKPIYRNINYGTKIYFQDLLEAYWTVRSFKIDFNIVVINGEDPFFNYMAGGGGSFTAAGSIAGLSSATDAMNNGGSLNVKGYTKLVHRNYKTIKKIKNGLESDEADIKIKPNPKESYIYKPNEGTMVSPGPVHSFIKNNFRLKIDFSDIIMKKTYLGNIYFPNITIYGNTPNFNFTAGNVTISSNIKYINFMGNLIPVYINLNKPSLFPPLILFNCTIEPGDRCCDRFYWDGKDKEREEEEDCESCNDNISTEDIKKDGVYLKPEKTSEK